MGARFSINSEFKPYSFQEMIAPYVMYGNEYRRQEEEYNQLNQLSEYLGSLLDEENDSQSYNKYQNYMQELNNQAGDLSSNGLSVDTRNALLKLKGRYAKDIKPIETAYNRRKELQDEQRKAILSNPTLMFERDLNAISPESSIDRFVDNPNYTYGQSYSGMMLANQVSTAAKSLSKTLRENSSEGRNLRSNLEKVLPYQYRILQQNGFSEDDVMKAILNSSDANPILTGIVDNVMNDSGMYDWANDATIAKARAYANQGLYDAIGPSDYKYISDEYGMRMGVEDEKTKREAYKAALRSKNRSEFVDRSAILFPKDKVSVEKFLDNKYIFNQKFFKDGKFSKPEYNQSIKTGDLNTPDLLLRRDYKSDVNIYNDVFSILENAGYSKEDIDNMSKDDVKNALADIKNENVESDVIGRNIYKFTIDKDSVGLLNAKVNNISKSPMLREITGRKDGKYSYGKSSKSDFEDSVNILYDPTQDVFMIQANGSYYEIPKGILSSDTYANIKSDISRYNDIVETLDYYDEAFNIKGFREKHPESVQAYIDLKDEILEIDKRLSEYGKEFVNYTGKRNINK